MLVREASNRDASQVAEIYNHYIKTSYATFEIETVGALEMIRRIDESLGKGYPFLVAEIDGEVLGYAYGHEYRPRAAYGRSVEISVYIQHEHQGKGIASRLYQILIPVLINAGYHAMIAGISLPNEASVRLHERFGFEKVAHFREVGRKFDRWIDVGYWQRLALSSERARPSV